VASLVPLIFLLFLGAVIIIPIWLRERTKQSAHQLISQALEKGQPLDPAIMRELTQGTVRQTQVDRPRRSLGSAVTLTALGVAFVAIAYTVDDMSFLRVPGFILGALGVAFLLLAIVDYSAKKRDM
ncbi:MAG: hypothetical protein HY054_03680, partial [Proteobacteria bacterium]|nr:hypothetical protein [Pseudomonadota bacterium]